MPQSIPAIFRETFPPEPVSSLGFGYPRPSSSSSSSSSTPTPPLRIPHFPFVHSLQGQTAIVTGGYGGIGLETCWALLQAGARVYVAGRDAGKFEEAVRVWKERSAVLHGVGQGKAGLKVRRTKDWPSAELPAGEVAQEEEADADSRGEVGFLKCDLGSLESVRAAAEEFSTCEQHLNMLFCSAGVMASTPGLETAEGHDLQFGTNVLGHFYLIHLLTPRLLSASSPASPARICLTSSSGHNLHATPCFSAADPYADKTLLNRVSPTLAGPWIKYGHSKVGDILLAEKLFRLHWLGEGQGESTAGAGKILTTSCNPGNLRTDLFRWAFPTFKSPVEWSFHPLQALLAFVDVLRHLFFALVISPFILHEPGYGAVSQLYANTAAPLPESADAGEDKRGKEYAPYFIPWARRTSPCPQASAHTVEGRQSQDELWEWCLKAVREFESGRGK